MGVHNTSVASSTLVTNTTGAGNEAIAVQTPPMNLPLDNAQVQIFWRINATGGAGTTFMTIRLRRTSLTGTLLLDTGGITFPATEVFEWGGCFFDTPGASAGVVYCLCRFPTGGADTINSAAIVAMSL